MNRIGIDTKQAEKLAQKLNELLANYQVFYINIKGFHWNVRGEKFFELHAKFEEIYQDLFIKIDEIAERILTLGYSPLHTYSSYLENAKIKEVSNVIDGKSSVQNVVDSYEFLITKQRELLSLSDEFNDEGSNALMSDYIREQEKLIWMYLAFLG